MALKDIYTDVRRILYGQGLGETPAIRITASNANETTAGDLVNYTLDTGEAEKVKIGNTLAVHSPDSASTAFVTYVLAVNTTSDVITAVNGTLHGAPAIAGADSGDMDDRILEQNPLVTSHEIHSAIEAIIEQYLWPDVYDIESKTITAPDLIDGQEAVPADTEEILAAWQIIGPTNERIAFQRHPDNVSTSLASTGRQAAFDWIDGSTGHFQAKVKITNATTNSAIQRLIATGAAALALGGTITEATVENTKKDNADAVAQRNQVSGLLWRDFLTTKQELARELGRDNESQVLIDRG